MQIAPKHDFVSKFRQEKLLPDVLKYVEWQRAVRQARRDGVEPPFMPPIGLSSINLDLTTACNYRCGHCIDFDKLNTGINHENYELFESLENLVGGGLKSVILIGGGEPTIHPRFLETVAFLKNRSVAIGIVTNGSRGDILAKAAALLAKGDWIRLSLDAGTDATFQKMHLPRNKGVNLEGICASVPQIRAANPDIQVGFSYIIVWQGAERSGGHEVVPNVSEIVAAARLTKENQFNYISYKPFLTRFEDGSEVMDASAMDDANRTMTAIRSALLEAHALETEKFQVLESTNLRVLMTGNWRDFTNQPKTCHMMAFRQVLSPLGVYHCPAKRGIPNSRVANKDAYVPSQTPETRGKFLRMLENFDASRECAEITCLYNSANWWIENLIEGTGDPALSAELPDRGDYYL